MLLAIFSAVISILAKGSTLALDPPSSKLSFEQRLRGLNWVGLCVAAGFVAILCVASAVLETQVPNTQWLWASMAIGFGVMALVSVYASHNLKALDQVAGVGVPCIAFACLSFIPGITPLAGFGIVVGAGLTGLILGMANSPNLAAPVVHCGWLACVHTMLVVTVGSEAIGYAPAIAASLAVAFGLSLYLRDRVKFLDIWLVALSALLLGAGTFVSTKSWMITLIAVSGVLIAAVFLLFQNNSGRYERFAFVGQALGWLGAAAIAFSVAKGTGVSILLVGALAGYFSLGGGRSVLAVGPLFALALLRAGRELFPGSIGSFEIGQYYAVIGTLLGALLPIAILAALADEEDSAPVSTIRNSIWALMGLAASFMTPLLLGLRGATGWIVGTGFAPVLEGYTGSKKLSALAYPVSLSATVILVTPFLGSQAELSRNEKVIWLSALTAVVVLLCIALTLLAKRPIVANKNVE